MSIHPILDLVVEVVVLVYMPSLLDTPNIVVCNCLLPSYLPTTLYIVLLSASLEPELINVIMFIYKGGYLILNMIVLF